MPGSAAARLDPTHADDAHESKVPVQYVECTHSSRPGRQWRSFARARARHTRAGTQARRHLRGINPVAVRRPVSAAVVEAKRAADKRESETESANEKSAHFWRVRPFHTKGKSRALAFVKIAESRLITMRATHAKAGRRLAATLFCSSSRLPAAHAPSICLRNPSKALVWLTTTRPSWRSVQPGLALQCAIT